MFLKPISVFQIEYIEKEKAFTVLLSEITIKKWNN